MVSETGCEGSGGLGFTEGVLLLTSEFSRNRLSSEFIEINYRLEKEVILKIK